LAANYTLAWDSDNWTPGLVNTTTVRVSGVLQSDACDGPCQAVAGVEVTVSLSGTGQLAVDNAPAQRKASGPPARSVLRVAPVAPTVNTTTDKYGAFVVLVSSSTEGESSLVARVTIANTTVDSNAASVSWYMPQASLEVVPQYFADTVSAMPHRMAALG
jgi:hypothetical protein